MKYPVPAKYRRKTWKLTEREKAEAVQAHKRQEPLADIASRFGINKSAVTNLVRTRRRAAA